MKKDELVNEVATYYRSKGHKRWHLKPKERQLLEDRIGDGYTLDELKMAVDGLHMTDWNIGNNPSGKKYLGLYYALHEDKIDGRIQTAQDSMDREERERKRVRRQVDQDAEREKSRKEMMNMPNISAELKKAMRSG